MYFVILLGRAWAAATTEGLMIYSLDSSMVFDPFDLDIEVTPNSTRKALAKGEYSTALILSFKLNEMKLKQEVLEHIPVSSGKCKKRIVNPLTTCHFMSASNTCTKYNTCAHKLY